MPDLEKKLREYEHEYEELNTLRDLEKKLEKLKQQMAWAHVTEAEEVRYLKSVFGVKFQTSPLPK